jgi:hypothetical protein
MFFLDVYGCHAFRYWVDLFPVVYSGDPVGTGTAAADFVGAWGELVTGSWELLG